MKSEIPPTYTIAPDGKSITCLRCHQTSHHPKDVEHRYCGHCKVFHEDIPEADRRAWIAAAPGTALNHGGFIHHRIVE